MKRTLSLPIKRLELSFVRGLRATVAAPASVGRRVCSLFCHLQVLASSGQKLPDGQHLQALGKQTPNSSAFKGTANVFLRNVPLSRRTSSSWLRTLSGTPRPPNWPSAGVTRLDNCSCMVCRCSIWPNEEDFLIVKLDLPLRLPVTLFSCWSR